MKKGGAAFPAAPHSFKDRKVFDALEWLAAMCSHVPNWGGADGKVLRLVQQCLAGEKAEGTVDGIIPCLI